VAFLTAAFGFAAAAMAGESGEAAAAGIPLVWWIAPVGALLALVFAVYFYRKMMGAAPGTETMIEIARYVREGAYAYLFRQYGIVSIVFLILVVIFAFLAYFGVQNPFVPVAFLTGGFFSGLCGFLGMKTATNASSRTADLACWTSHCGF
jgi:K(+)-stimulated pyrophosphate-energized sodium pump